MDVFFSAFCSESTFSSNVAGFKSQDFYSLSWTTMGGIWVSLTKITVTIKLLSEDGGKVKCLD